MKTTQFFDISMDKNSLIMKGIWINTKLALSEISKTSATLLLLSLKRKRW